MDDMRFGALVREVRLRRGLRQQELAALCGLAQSTISLVERGHWAKLSVETLRRIAAALDIRVELLGRWRGGDADRLLSHRHSALAESVAASVGRCDGWAIFPEATFSVFGERGVVDQLWWHAVTRHLVIVELKTAFVDINEMLGTLDRKLRLAGAIARERGLDPATVSVWLIVLGSSTNRRHARRHCALLDARFQRDGRFLASFLRKPAGAVSGLAFWPASNGSSTRPRRAIPTAEHRAQRSAFDQPGAGPVAT
jgi:transcriptional regulator with XRE-family HTH domain